MTPTLHDLFLNPRVKGINFWCKEHASSHGDLVPTGEAVIDYGARTTLPDLCESDYCRRCHGPVQVSSSWGEGGFNPFENLGGDNASGEI